MSWNVQQVMESHPRSHALRDRSAERSDGDFAARAAAWALKGPLTAALLALCGIQLATWLPHYITWPWFADHDVFATMALGWHHGQLPYRDLAGNNFPGTVYLFWILGTVFGWGRTVPLYAVDGALVLVLGATLLAWSRRRFGRWLPGVVGYAVFLSYYLSLSFGEVAQRDWHGPGLVLTGLLIVDAFPGRVARALAALALAAGFSIRPQIVVFLPALLLAVARTFRTGNAATLEGEDATHAGAGPETTWGPTIRGLLGWVALSAALTILAFVPLWAAGIFDDFLHGVGLVVYGASYNKASMAMIGNQMLLQFLHLEFDLVPLAVLLLAPLGGTARAATARLWLLVYLGAWVYKPLSPVPFPYLEHPLQIAWAVNVAVLVELLLAARLAHPAVRLVAVLLAARLGVHARPYMCSIAYARQGIEALRRGEDPREAPLGLHIAIPLDPKALAYPWEDYRATLAYVRTNTTPETRVANLLHVVPALNGSTGRPTPLPAESLAWLMVHPDDERRFGPALEAAPAGSLVVWTPVKGRFIDRWSHYDEVERLAPVIRQNYSPLARFGDIEIWRRDAGGGAGPPGPPQ
jgi:hypothetical protein